MVMCMDAVTALFSTCLVRVVVINTIELVYLENTKVVTFLHFLKKRPVNWSYV